MYRKDLTMNLSQAFGVLLLILVSTRTTECGPAVAAFQIRSDNGVSRLSPRDSSLRYFHLENRERLTFPEMLDEGDSRFRDKERIQNVEQDDEGDHHAVGAISDDDAIDDSWDLASLTDLGGEPQFESGDGNEVLSDSGSDASGGESWELGSSVDPTRRPDFAEGDGEDDEISEGDREGDESGESWDLGSSTDSEDKANFGVDDERVEDENVVSWDLEPFLKRKPRTVSHNTKKMFLAGSGTGDDSWKAWNSGDILHDGRVQPGDHVVHKSPRQRHAHTTKHEDPHTSGGVGFLWILLVIIMVFAVIAFFFFHRWRKRKAAGGGELSEVKVVKNRPSETSPFKEAYIRHGKRKSSENRKVLKRLSKDERVSTLMEELALACSLISPTMDTRRKNSKGLNTRACVKAATSHSRRNSSFQEDLQMARAIIMPPPKMFANLVVLDRDENADNIAAKPRDSVVVDIE